MEFLYLIIFLSFNTVNELIQVLLYVDIKHWQTISVYYSDLNYETQNKWVLCLLPSLLFSLLNNYYTLGSKHKYSFNLIPYTFQEIWENKSAKELNQSKSQTRIWHKHLDTWALNTLNKENLRMECCLGV